MTRIITITIVFLITILFLRNKLCHTYELMKINFEQELNEITPLLSNYAETYDKYPSSSEEVIKFANLIGASVDTNNFLLKNGMGSIELGETEFLYIYGLNGKNDNGNKMIVKQNLNKYPFFSDFTWNNCDIVIGIKSAKITEFEIDTLWEDE